MSDAPMGELVAETTTMKGDGRQTCRILRGSLPLAPAGLLPNGSRRS
jgi:hypothetical protein